MGSNAIPLRREISEHTHRRRTSCNGRGRGWNEAAISPGVSIFEGQPLEVRKRQGRSFRTGFRGGLAPLASVTRLLVSEAVIGNISVLLNHPVCRTFLVVQGPAAAAMKGESESHSVVSHSLRPHGLCCPWNSPGQNTGVGSLSLLQGIFPTQGLNPGLPHCRRILYQRSHQGIRVQSLVEELGSRMPQGN